MIRNITFNNIEQLYTICDSSHVLKKGIEGTSYLVGNDVWKIFNEVGTSQHPFQILLQNQALKIPSFAFVQGGIFLKDTLVGGRRPFIKGASLKSYDLAGVPIKVLVSAANQVCMDTETLSLNGIQTYDIRSSSILFDGHHFHMISTISYKKTQKDEKSLYEYNIKSFSRTLFQEAIPPDIKEYLQTRPYLKGYLTDPYLLQTPGGLLMQVKQDVESRIGTEIKTFHDAEKKLIR